MSKILKLYNYFQKIILRIYESIFLEVFISNCDSFFVFLEIYGIEVYAEMVSKITDKIILLIEEW